MRIALLVVLVGCGTDSVPFAAPADAPPDTPVLPAGCDYVELADPTNDFTIIGGAPEVTGLALQQATTLCGTLDLGNFNTAAMTVDVDGFEVEVEETKRVLVTLVGDGSTLDSLELQRLDTTNVVRTAGAYLGTHAVFEDTLLPGRHRFAVVAKDAVALTAAIPYKIVITVDDLDQRCARVTAAATYVEANDGPQSDRNDTIEVRYAPPEKLLTAANNDLPEPSGVYLLPGQPLRVTGTHADVDAADDFRDRDAYGITVDGETAQLAVRVDWTGDADLDFFFFNEADPRDFGRGTSIAKTGPEHATFPIVGGMRYWMWIGSYDSSAGLPVTYDVTICPSRAPAI